MNVTLYPQVDYKKWANMYCLSLTPIPCPKCKKEFIPTIPIAIKNYRGLKAKLHKCGKRYQAFRVVPIGKQEIKFWKNIIGEL